MFVVPVFLIIPKSLVTPSVLSVRNPMLELAFAAAVLICQHSNPSPARLSLCCCINIHILQSSHKVTTVGFSSIRVISPRGVADVAAVPHVCH